MPYFAIDDFEIDPDEYVGSCNSREIKELIEALVEDGHIQSGSEVTNQTNSLDDYFTNSILHLTKCRLLMTTTEENFILDLYNRFKYLK